MASIGIVGAGIGGLTSALAIARTHCHEVTIYEASTTTAGQPIPLHLPPNASRVFKALGLEPTLAEQAHHAQRQQIRTSKQGFQLAELPLGELAAARYNAPYFTLPQDLLVTQIAAALPADVSLLENHQCTQVDAQQGMLSFANDHQATHDLVVIAAGANSPLVEQLSFHRNCTDTHQQLTLGKLAHDAKLVQKLPSGLNQWLGPNRWFSHWPLDDIGTLGFAAVSEPAQDLKQLSQIFESWHPLVGSIIEHGETVSAEPIVQQHALKEWQDAKAVLLGDAAHPVLPFTDQSAALAIEDAWVLSRMLEQQEKEPTKAAREYVRYRLRRCERVQQFANAQGLSLQQPERQKIWQRNIKLSLGSRFLPEWALAKFDWLYGYDCVRGFH